MKKIHAVALSLVAVFAFCAVSAASAFAEETIQWLDNGELIATPIPTDGEVGAEGILLEDTKGGIFGEQVDYLCSILFSGTVGPENQDTITEVLNLEMTSSLVENCEVMEGSCPDPMFDAVNLPWLTELKEGAGGSIYDLLADGGKGKWGFIETCLGVFGEEIVDTCTSAEGEKSAAYKMTNLAGGIVFAEFNETETENGSCTRGGAGAERLQAELLTKATEAGLSLTVSLGL